MPKVSPPNDKLRGLLDRLAEDLVKETLADGEATARGKADVLKTVGGWWASSRGKDPEPPEPESAWDQYHNMMNGKQNAETDKA